MKRILDYDPVTKTVQFYHEDELTGDVALETRQDITAIVEHNKFLYNQFDENARWTDPLRPSVGQTHYARLPTVIHAQLMKITNNGKIIGVQSRNRFRRLLLFERGRARHPLKPLSWSRLRCLLFAIHFRSQ